MIPGEWERGRWTEVREASEEVTFETDLKGLIGHEQVEKEHTGTADREKRSSKIIGALRHTPSSVNGE